MQPTYGIPRRHAIGMAGGIKTKRDYWFAPRDGDKYPSESMVIQSNRLPDDPLKQRTWLWALSKMAAEGCWLVVPLDPDNRRNEAARVRSALWRTAQRRGLSLTSELVGDRIYVNVVAP